MGRRRLCLNSSVKAAVPVAPTARGADPKHRVRQSLSQSYSSEKAIFLASAFCLSNVRCFSKRLKNTVACCYETYRMRREGKVESPSHFAYCRDISTDRHRGRGGVGGGS